MTPHEAQGAIPLYALVRSAAAVVLVPIVLFLWQRAGREPGGRGVAGFRLIASFIVVAFGAVQLAVIAANLRHTQEFDFMAFWIWGRVAAQGRDLYDLANYPEFMREFPLTEAFRQEAIATGFLYPPQTMLLFAPLGFFGVKTALTLWYGLHVAALIANIVLIGRVFFPDRGRDGLLLGAALLLMLPATSNTFRFGQTNELTLLFLLLLWRDLDRPRGGVWLALAPVVKPYLALLWLFPVLARRWRMLGVFFATTLAVALVTMALFGADVFVRYRAAHPESHYQGFVFTQIMNQSLLATILRWRHLGSPPPGFLEPTYVVISALVMLVTLGLTFARGRARAPWAVTLLLGAALIVAPGTLQHYHLMLIAPMAQLWKERGSVPGGAFAAGALVTGIYALCLYPHGALIFWAFVLVWTFAVARALAPAPETAAARG